MSEIAFEHPPRHFQYIPSRSSHKLRIEGGYDNEHELVLPTSIGHTVAINHEIYLGMVSQLRLHPPGTPDAFRDDEDEYFALSGIQTLLKQQPGTRRVRRSIFGRWKTEKVEDLRLVWRIDTKFKLTPTIMEDSEGAYFSDFTAQLKEADSEEEVQWVKSAIEENLGVFLGRNYEDLLASNTNVVVARRLHHRIFAPIFPLLWEFLEKAEEIYRRGP